jgi:hypothetical protein
MVNCLALSYIA